MRVSAVRMAQHFGQLIKVKGIVTHSLSPFEQRAFAKAVSFGIPNLIRRFRDEVFYVVPPFLIGYATYAWIDGLHHEYSRKNPKDYENDV
ncbi:cytochrome b-c1 complex subunit 8 [Culicoides brevitarsis]|uniref:cytochrome b-c1 complex subunit 8 n=1 Tax=Culicoides brevitarsis TaxID=469753 RepID=UPI00307CB549